jgi:pyrimidine operon attenuation protein/uracil phosphoribosyltransferase
MSNTTDDFDAEALYRTLLEQVRGGLAGVPDAAIVGIHSGGAWLAERLARDLGLEGRLGFIDVSFYRDDYAKKGLHPDVKPTHIPFNVDRAAIVLVDDVLYTGRTVRAAIDALFDYGRPSRVQLAVLADRGHRELPIRPDYVGKNLPTARGERVNVRVEEIDGMDEVAIDAAAHMEETI